MPREREDRRRDDRDDEGEERGSRRKGGGYEYRGKERTVEGVVRHSKSSGVFDSIIVGGLITFKPKEGENTIRILPPTWKDLEKWGDMWDIAVRVHYSVGADNGSYLCLKLNDEECPICEARQDLEKAEADALRPNERRVVWLIDRNDEKSGPKIWSMPKKKVFDEIVNRSIDKKTKALLHVDDPDEGYDITFTREGTDERTDYVGIEVLRDPCPIHDKESTQDKWMDYVVEHPLPECLNFYEADYIEGVLAGRRAPARNKDEDEGDSRGSRSSSRSSGSGRGSERDKEAGSARRRPLVEEDETEPEGRSERRRPSRAEPDAEAEPEKDERDARPTPRGGRSSTPTTRRSDPEDGEEVEERSARPRPRSSAKDDEDEGEGEEDLRARPRSSRKVDKEEETDAEDEPKTSRGARQEMSRLRERASK